MKKIKNDSLYLVITEEYGKGRSAMEIARFAIEGGVDIIQMREKNKPKDELIGMGKDLARICKANDVIFIVNDDPALAAEVGADGVHLGQEDALKYSTGKARKALGPDKIIGISTHSMAQFTAANDSGVDYIAFGPVFETKTKDYFIGTEEIAKVLNIAKKPVFFIGGINLVNIREVLNRGAKGVALIRGITEADDITKITGEFKKALKDGNKDKRQE
jgi:thiamine-phosphate pyrophosphorylase